MSPGALARRRQRGKVRASAKARDSVIHGLYSHRSGACCVRGMSWHSVHRFFFLRVFSFVRNMFYDCIACALTPCETLISPHTHHPLSSTCGGGGGGGGAAAAIAVVVAHRVLLDR